MLKISNLKTLKNLKDRTPEERHAIAVKGAHAGNKRKRELKETREYMSALLSLPLPDGFTREELDAGGIPKKNLNRRAGMLLGLLRKAETGDPRAVELILKLTGDYPADRQELTINQNEGFPGQDIRISWVDNEMNEVDHDIIHCPPVPASQMPPGFRKKQ